MTRAACILVFMLAALSVVWTDSHCSAQRMQFTITSKVEESMERILKVDLMAEQPDHLSLSVDHLMKVCGVKESLTLSVVAAIPGRNLKSYKTTHIVTANATTLQKGKPAVLSGYMLIPGVGYYKLNKTTVSWEESWRVCEAEGTTMAVPDSQKELQALIEKLRSLKISKAPWLGVKKTNGKWTTLQGAPFSGPYVRWRQGYPTAQGDCLYLNVDGVGNAPCNLLSNFICEEPLL